jgi:hypothetical protein
MYVFDIQLHVILRKLHEEYCKLHVIQDDIHVNGFDSCLMERELLM